jgi:hypothetical protein
MYKDLKCVAVVIVILVVVVDVVVVCGGGGIGVTMDLSRVVSK